MKYLGNTLTGEVFAASNYQLICGDYPKELAMYYGEIVEVTGYQKGEFMAIARHKDPETKKYEFKRFTTRQYKELKRHKEELGWEIRKEYKMKTTYDEYPFLGQVPNSIEEKKQKK